MKKTGLIFFLLSFQISFHAQTLNLSWADGMGGSSNETANALCLDNNGHVIHAGTLGSTNADFDPGAGTYTLGSNGNVDGYVSKLDGMGNFVWAKQFGSTGQDEAFAVACDNAGNVYYGGIFSNTVDFDPGPSTFTLASAGYGDMIISKLDAFGNFVWAKRLGGSGTEWVTFIKVDGNGDLLITGNFQGTVDFDPGPGTFTMTNNQQNGFLLKLDASGNFIFAKQFTAFSYCYSVETYSNVLYVCGAFTGTIDVDPGAGSYTFASTPGKHDSYILALDPSGNFVWGDQLAGFDDTYAYSVRAGNNGDLYISGTFFATSDFDPGAGINYLTSAGSWDAFLCKLNSAGNFLWARQFGGSTSDNARTSFSDASGKVFVAGDFSTVADLDPGPGTFTMQSQGLSDMFICELDAAGNFLYAGVIGGTGYDDCLASVIDPVGKMHFCGYYDGTADFDVGAGTSTLSSNGRDVCVMQYTLCTTSPTVPASIVGSNSLCAGAVINLTVAPVAGATTYSWVAPAGWTGNSFTNSLTATSGSSGVFTVYALNACGMSAAQTKSVTVNPVPSLSITASSTMLCAGDAATVYATGATAYTWTPGGNNFSIAVNPTVTSTYTVNGTNAFGCSTLAVIQIVVSSCTGIETANSENKRVALYPNPALSELQIRSELPLGKISLVNSMGEIVYAKEVNESELTLDVSKLTAGIYFVVIIESGQVKKFVKE